MNDIFWNIEELYDFHLQFYSDLILFESGDSDKNFDYFFSKLMDSLRFYKTFCLNSNFALESVDRLLSSSPSFADFISVTFSFFPPLSLYLLSLLPSSLLPLFPPPLSPLSPPFFFFLSPPSPPSPFFLSPPSPPLSSSRSSPQVSSTTRVSLFPCSPLPFSFPSFLFFSLWLYRLTKEKYGIDDKYIGANSQE